MHDQATDIPKTGFDLLDQLVRDTPPTVNGDKLSWDWFFEEMDRYTFDFGLQLTPEDDPAAWNQLDTDQDAPYFGVWIQRRDRMILTWAEGDLSLRHFKTPEAYDEALLRVCRTHPPAPAFSTFDLETNTLTRYVDDRRHLFYDPSKLDAIED